MPCGERDPEIVVARDIVGRRIDATLVHCIEQVDEMIDSRSIRQGETTRDILLAIDAIGGGEVRMAIDDHDDLPPNERNPVSTERILRRFLTASPPRDINGASPANTSPAAPTTASMSPSEWLYLLKLSP